MVDWKKIRDELHGFGFPEYQELQRFQEDNFSNLISALEEQEKRIEFLEKALDEAIDSGGLQLVVYPDGMRIAPRFESVGKRPALAKCLEGKNG